MATETMVNFLADMVLKDTDIYKRVSEKAKPSLSILLDEQHTPLGEEEKSLLARMKRTCRFDKLLLGSNMDLCVGKWLPPFGYAMLLDSDTTLNPNAFMGTHLYHGFSMCMVKKPPGGGRLRDEDILTWKKRMNVLIRDVNLDRSPNWEAADDPLGNWVPSLGSNSWIGLAEYHDNQTGPMTSISYALYVFAGIPDATRDQVDEVMNSKQQSYKEYGPLNEWCQAIAMENRARLLYLALLSLGWDTDHPKETRVNARYEPGTHPPSIEWLLECGFKHPLNLLPAFLEEPKRVPQFCPPFPTREGSTTFVGGAMHPIAIQPRMDVFLNNMTLLTDPKEHVLITSGRCLTNVDMIPKLTGPRQCVRLLELNVDLKEDSRYLNSIPCQSKQERDGHLLHQFCQDMFWEDAELKKNSLCESRFEDDVSKTWLNMYPKIKGSSTILIPVLVRVSCVDSFHEVIHHSNKTMGQTKMRFDPVDGKQDWVGL